MLRSLGALVVVYAILWLTSLFSSNIIRSLGVSNDIADIVSAYLVRIESKK